MKRIRPIICSLVIAVLCSATSHAAPSVLERVRSHFQNDANNAVVCEAMRKFTLKQIERMGGVNNSGWITDKYQIITDFYHACNKNVSHMCIVLGYYISAS